MLEKTKENLSTLLVVCVFTLFVAALVSSKAKGVNMEPVWGFDKQYVYSSGDLVFIQKEDGSITLEDNTMGYGIGYATASGSVSLYDLLNPGTFSMTKAN